MGRDDLNFLGGEGLFDMKVVEKISYKHRAGKSTLTHTQTVGSGRVVFEVKMPDKTIRLDRSAARRLLKDVQKPEWAKGVSPEYRAKVIQALKEATS